MGTAKLISSKLSGVMVTRDQKEGGKTGTELEGKDSGTVLCGRVTIVNSILHIARQLEEVILSILTQRVDKCQGEGYINYP